MSARHEHQKVQLTMESARSLKPGDIIEGSYYMLWHPYVVQSVIPRGSYTDAEWPDSHVTLRVIHYGRRDLLEGIAVLQENLTLDAAKAATFQLYRFPEGDCRPDDEVVQLARERVGEAAHKIWSNNATYFALSCKLTDEAFKRHTQAIGRFRICYSYNPFSIW